MTPFCPSPPTFSPFLGNHPAPLGSWLNPQPPFIPLQLLGHDLERSRIHGASPGKKTGKLFIVTEWNQRIIGYGMRVLLGGGAVWALTQQCCLLLRTSQLGGRVCTLALWWSTVALMWQAAGSLSPHLRGGTPQWLFLKGAQS